MNIMSPLQGPKAKGTQSLMREISSRDTQREGHTEIWVRWHLLLQAESKAVDTYLKEKENKGDNEKVIEVL